MATRKTRRPKKTARSVASATRSRQAPESFVPLLAHLVVPWMLLALLEIGLSTSIRSTSLMNAQLPLGARIGLAAYELALLAIAVGAVGVFVSGLAHLSRSGATSARRWLTAVVRVVIVWIAVLLYGTSWTAFWNTGVFLDRDAFLFWLPHPLQTFHWVYPPLAIGVVILTTAVAVALDRVVPRWVAQGRPSVQRRLVMVGGSSAVSCAVAAFTGGLVYGANDSAPDGSRSDYAVQRDDRSGPLVHAVADLRRRLRPAADPPASSVSDAIDVIRRPLISMDQYVAGVDRARMKPWNVVAIQVESLRADQLRAYGGTRDVMPTIDALARQSHVFTNAYIQASHSNYADLVPLSSHYPMRYPQIYSYPPNPTYPRVLVYDVLKALGYKTAVFSSQNENWSGMVNYHRPESLDRFFHAETFDGPTYTPWEDGGFANWVRRTRSAGSVDDRHTVSEAIRWIESVPGAPFFLHMNLQSSHVPYVVPEGFPRPFGPRKLDFAILWGEFPIEKLHVVKDRYADSLNYEDTQIARLFDTLRRRGLWDTTVIIIGGDNGEAFYEHGFSSHASSVFNEVMKVPMIVFVPGAPPQRDDRPAMFLDVPPSVLDILGLPPHPSFQGISLFQPQPDPNRSIYMMAQTPLAQQQAIVRSGHKLLYTEVDRRYLLFDLVNDPGEQNNIRASRPDLVEALGIRLHRWRREHLDYYADVARHNREYPPVLPD